MSTCFATASALLTPYISYYGEPGDKFHPLVERLVRWVGARHIGFLAGDLRKVDGNIRQGSLINAGKTINTTRAAAPAIRWILVKVSSGAESSTLLSRQLSHSPAIMNGRSSDIRIQNGFFFFPSLTHSK